LNNIIKGVIITLFVIGLVWALEAIFSYNSAYVVSVIKSVLKRATPGFCLMLPGIGLAIFEYYKRTS